MKKNTRIPATKRNTRIPTNTEFVNSISTARESTPSKGKRINLLRNGLIFDESKYEYKEDFVPAKPDQPLEAHTTMEMVECMRKNPKIQLEARVLGTTANGDRTMTKMNRDQFLEAVKGRDSKRLRESMDAFSYSDPGYSYGNGGNTGGLIGRDFTPLLGGPFNKQLYYQDYLRMISTCFFAYHHDPVARDIVSIITDFTVGRGFKLTTNNEKAQILWDAFADANDIDQQMDYAATELSIYGENMWWWLPDNQTRISFNPMQGEKVPHGILPRVRLIDPSNIAEIVTVPEDMIKGVLYYVWLAPTQYQMWTDGKQPATKFIYTQIPADQIMHFKINTVSNEKRGRSDYFPALGYMKRLRDSVNYSLVAQQKASAWCVDTTIQGNDEDIAQYIADQQALGPIPPAGSEFVHTDSIKREYVSNAATGKASDSPTFSWCLSMICMSSGIPLSYLGTHLSGGNTRASALVTTEPVAKRFERRRNVYERMIHGLFDGLMARFGMSAECEITFPELITQDRSAKLRDLMLAQNSGWLSKSRVAEIAAKEFDIEDYDFPTEQALMDKEGGEVTSPTSTSPLTTPAKNPQTGKSSGVVTGPEKKQVKDNLRQL